MATLKELRDERLRKLEALQKLGINPYPSKTNRSHVLSEIVDTYDELHGKTVSAAGRIQNIRKFGKIAFIVIKDMNGSLQLFLTPDKVGKLQAKDSELGFEQLSLLD